MKSVRDWEHQQMQNTPRPETQIITLLTEHLESIGNLRSEENRESSIAFEEWQSSVDSILRRIFGEKSPEREKFNEINYYPTVGSINEYVDYTADYIKAYNDGLDKASGQLRSIIKMLQSLGMPVSQPVIKKTGTTISVNPIFNQNQNNEMKQEQHQEVNITLEQALDNSLSYIKQHHTEETIKNAEDVLQPLKEKDVTWPQVQKAIMFFLGLGREAFFAFAPVLYQMAMTKP